MECGDFSVRSNRKVAFESAGPIRESCGGIREKKQDQNA
jgi:hypothetical protein